MVHGDELLTPSSLEEREFRYPQKVEASLGYYSELFRQVLTVIAENGKHTEF